VQATFLHAGAQYLLRNASAVHNCDCLGHVFSWPCSASKLPGMESIAAPELVASPGANEAVSLAMVNMSDAHADCVYQASVQ